MSIMTQKEPKELNRVSRRPETPGGKTEPGKPPANESAVANAPGCAREVKTVWADRCPPGAFVYEPPPPEAEPVVWQEESADSLSKQIRELTEEVRQLRSQLSFVQTEGGLAEALEKSGESFNEPEEKKNTVLNVISNILFYLVIIGLVVSAFLIKSSSGGRPIMIAGFSAFRVLTSSMEEVYPKGSLIISKSVDPFELAVGDDITFMVSETSSVTHRIIGITQNYLGTGKPGFETQGVMNQKPDRDMVASANVVGKVVFCSRELGELANFMKNNWPILLFAVSVMMALFVFLKWNAQRGDEEPQPRKKAPPKQAAKHVKK